MVILIKRRNFQGEFSAFFKNFNFARFARRSNSAKKSAQIERIRFARKA